MLRNIFSVDSCFRIEGDLFVPIVPNNRHLLMVRTRLEETERGSELICKRQFYESSFYTFDRGHPATFVKQEEAPVTDKLFGHTGELVVAEPGQMAFYAPCLIPLDKDGSIIKLSDAGQDGEIVTWGSGVADGDFVPVAGEDGRLPSKNLHQTSTLELTDTGDEQYAIRWMWMNGLLFPLNFAVYISVDDLQANGLLRTDISWCMKEAGLATDTEKKLAAQRLLEDMQLNSLEDDFWLVRMEENNEHYDN